MTLSFGKSEVKAADKTTPIQFDSALEFRRIPLLNNNHSSRSASKTTATKMTSWICKQPRASLEYDNRMRVSRWDVPE